VHSVALPSPKDPAGHHAQAVLCPCTKYVPTPQQTAVAEAPMRPRKLFK
jgi:hypothetical protein